MIVAVSFDMQQQIQVQIHCQVYTVVLMPHVQRCYYPFSPKIKKKKMIDFQIQFITLFPNP